MRTIRVRDRVPEILLEAASIVFAVLLALGVNEWRDRRANEQSAAQAHARILSEVRLNLEELKSHAQENQNHLERIEATLAALDSPDTAGTVTAQIAYANSILSASAWESARVTGVVRYLDFDWVLRLSRIYEVQEQFREHQAELVASISGFSGEDKDLKAVLVPMRNRMSTVIAYQQGLAEGYEELLASE